MVKVSGAPSNGSEFGFAALGGVLDDGPADVEECAFGEDLDDEPSEGLLA